VEIEGKMCSVFVLVRPGAKEFLENLAPFFEMVIYTASLSKYADPLMDILDPKGICTSRLFREHCTFYNGIFVKDLSKIDRDQRDLLIIDNSPNSYLFQPESALPIVSWYDDMSDTILYDYIPMLQGIAVVDDVREALATFIYPNEPNEYDRIDLGRGLEILDQYIEKARE
jgi:carboxy-terminal domain RNA polymerase II polypeptide A small phosphatase